MQSQSIQSLSVLIPTLNAAAVLPSCLAALEGGREPVHIARLVVADGGSADATRELAAQAGAEVLTLPPGRGSQLAAGMERLAALGADWVLVVHADTRLAEDWGDAAARFLARHPQGGAAACFTLAFDDDSAPARRVARLANWRSRTLRLPYGDQGLLLRLADYQAAGGYPAEPLMEDVTLIRRLGRVLGRETKREAGWLTLLPARAITSAARYRRDGWWLRPARNLTILTLHFLGLKPRTLARLYARRRPSAKTPSRE